EGFGKGAVFLGLGFVSAQSQGFLNLLLRQSLAQSQKSSLRNGYSIFSNALDSAGFQPHQKYVVDALRAYSFVETGGEIVRAVNSPHDFFGASLARNTGSMCHEAPADALIAPRPFNIQIGNIQRAGCAVRIVTKMIEQIACHTTVLFGDQPGERRMFTK